MQALQFFEVYRGVVSPAEFEGLVTELSSGVPCIALEVAPPGKVVPLAAAVVMLFYDGLSFACLRGYGIPHCKCFCVLTQFFRLLGPHTGGSGVTAVEPLRTLCGPSDPELAKAVRPASLRAQFGSSTARNAVHCTDLEGDAQLEVSFFFMR